MASTVRPGSPTPPNWAALAPKPTTGGGRPGDAYTEA